MVAWSQPASDTASNASSSIILVKMCRLCCHKSDEDNPLTAGPHARGDEWPGWPWLYGCKIFPKGFICRICLLTFEYAGFCLEYANIKIFGESMATIKT